MNLYAYIILAAMLLDYILDLVAGTLNMKALRGELPPEFEGVYDAERYRASQEYARANTRFGFVVSSFGLAVTLAFWFSGGFNYLDGIVRGWGVGPLWSGLAYIGILIFARALLSLPFNIYGVFVIEERFGFNKTTPKTFILDLIKGVALGIALGGPILAGILAFFMYGGGLAWLYSWLAVVIFTLVIQFIAPTWIMPLFNKFTPLGDGELKDSILGFAEKTRFPLKGVYVMDGSRRSSKSNAFFTGFGRNKRIALFDTLIEKHTVPELVAILAHEIGHYKKKHIIKGIFLSIAHTGIMFYLLSMFISHAGLFDAFYMEERSVYAGLLFFGMLYSPIEMVLSVFMNVLSRRHEFEADRFAAVTTGRNDAMIEALKKLSKDNLSNLTPHPLNVFLKYSHPPVLERIRTLRTIGVS